MTNKPIAKKHPMPAPKSTPLFTEIRSLIDSARQRAAVAVNVELTLLYWQVGQRIQSELLKGERAEYGQQVLPRLADQLTAEYGKGWSQRNLANMVRFADCFSDQNILQALSAKLSWSHFILLIGIDDPLKRDFYAQMAQLEGWSTRTLGERIDAMLFERTALSKKPEETIRLELQALAAKGDLTPAMVLKDPYVLDFLELSDHYVEKDLEDAILRELEQFLLELDKSSIHVADYLTELPPRELFAAKLHSAIASARKRLEP